MTAVAPTPLLLRWQGVLAHQRNGWLGEHLELVAGLVLCGLMAWLPQITRAGLSLLIFACGLLWLIWATLVFAFGLIGLLMGAFAGDAPQNNRRAGRLLSVTLGVFAVTTLLGFVLISRRDSWLDVLGALALTPVHLGDWSDGEIIRAIREGVGRDGRALIRCRILFGPRSVHEGNGRWMFGCCGGRQWPFLRWHNSGRCGGHRLRQHRSGGAKQDARELRRI